MIESVPTVTRRGTVALAAAFARIEPGPRRAKARDLLLDVEVNGRIAPCRALTDLRADAIAIQHRGPASASDVAIIEFVDEIEAYLLASKGGGHE